MMISLSTLLSGCQNVSQTTQPNEELRPQNSSQENDSETQLISISNSTSSEVTLKVNALYEKGKLEESVLVLNKKETLTPDEIEFQVKALEKIDWSVFYNKAHVMNETVQPDPETGYIMFDYAEFKFLRDYPNYSKNDLLSVLRAYRNSDGFGSVDFAWLLYDLHNKFSTESEFLYENNEDYRNTIDSFTDENGDVIIP